MPVIKSAKKKLRKDRKREDRNKILKNALKKVLKDFAKKPGAELAKKVVKTVDKAAKNNIVHKNKASRIKSKVSKFFAKSKPTGKTPKKSSSKAKK